MAKDTFFIDSGDYIINPHAVNIQEICQSAFSVGATNIYLVEGLDESCFDVQDININAYTNHHIANGGKLEDIKKLKIDKLVFNDKKSECTATISISGATGTNVKRTEEVVNIFKTTGEGQSILISAINDYSSSNISHFSLLFPYTVPEFLLNGKRLANKPEIKNKPICVTSQFILKNNKVFLNIDITIEKDTIITIQFGVLNDWRSSNGGVYYYGKNPDQFLEMFANEIIDFEFYLDEVVDRFLN